MREDAHELPDSIQGMDTTTMFEHDHHPERIIEVSTVNQGAPHKCAFLLYFIRRELNH